MKGHIMKYLITLSLLFTLSMASEYQSLQPDNLINDFIEQGAGIDDNADVRYSTTVRFMLDGAQADGDWYIPNGWEKYKYYIPAGIGSASISFAAKPNASFRVHATFKADKTAKVDHVETSGSDYALTQETHAIGCINICTVAFSPNLVNSNNGGWVYIDVVEDAANIDSYYGDVNPYVIVGLTMFIKDKAMFNSWKNSVELLSNGQPGDAISSLTIVDKPKPYTSTTRVIPMDPAVDPTIDQDGDGYSPATGDCYDYDKTIYPGAPEIANDGIDQNCDGKDLVDLTILDQDKDGMIPKEGDCNDYNSAIYKGATDIPDNGIDEDCFSPVYEYNSIHAEGIGIIDDFDAQLINGDSIVVTKDIHLTADAQEENGEWYAPEWQHYKFYLPKGLDSATLTASGDITSDFRIHATFKANQNATITHVEPISVTAGLINNKETVEAVSVGGLAMLAYDTNFTNFEEGGYVYLDIVENPNVNINPAITLKLDMNMNDKETYNTWKNDVLVIHNGDPEDGDPEDSVDYMSMILSRPTENGKLILMGDLRQTYNIVKPSESGLLKLLRILPHHSMAYVNLENSYRSDILQLADKLQDKTIG